MTHSENKYAALDFPGKRPGEEIKLLIRKHWIIDLKIGIQFFFLALVPLGIGALGFLSLWNGEFNDGFYYPIIAAMAMLLAVNWWLYMQWLNEELDIVIITNERVIAHDQIDVLHRQVSETNIAQIQDVKGIEKGLLGSLFHFGSLDIQTAARDIHFMIKNVDTPYESARKLLDVRDHYVDKEKFEKEEDAKHYGHQKQNNPTASSGHSHSAGTWHH